MNLESIVNMGQNILQNSGNDNDNAANAIMSLVPKEILNKMPPAVRKFACSQAADACIKQAPEIFEILKNGGKLTGSDTEKLRAIAMNVFTNASKGN